MIYEVTKTETVNHILGNWQESLIWSCLQGTMGKIYANSKEQPQSAMALLGDFCFFAGEPDKELVGYQPEDTPCHFLIMVPQNEEWARVIEELYGDKAKRVTRYAIKKEKDLFARDSANLKRLQCVVDSLSDEYTLKMIDQELFIQLKAGAFCSDWVAQYSSYEEFEALGMGAVILHDGEAVSGASSYSGFIDGIEIEIDTKEDYRRKGLAYICGAKLILECTKKGWYPSWDAQNKWSVSLAEKLGYHFSHEYPAYEVEL